MRQPNKQIQCPKELESLKIPKHLFHHNNQKAHHSNQEAHHNNQEAHHNNQKAHHSNQEAHHNNRKEQPNNQKLHPSNLGSHLDLTIHHNNPVRRNDLPPAQKDPRKQPTN